MLLGLYLGVEPPVLVALGDEPTAEFTRPGLGSP